MRLKYKSLVTRENIKSILSKIQDEQTKHNLINLLSKIDIRVSTEPIIVGNEFYYKIWILKRGTKNKAHIKDYYSLKLLKEKLQSPITLAEVLEMVWINADVPDDFEEYCEIRLKDPSDSICRIDYLDDLRRAERFKKFLSQDEIRSMSFSFVDYNNNSEKEIDMNNESNLELLGYTIFSLNDMKEYDKLAELQSTLEYNAKIVESYGFDTYTGDFNEKMFPVTKEDKQMENIAKDFKNYDQAVSEYDDYLKELIKKYNIKPTGNLVKRIAFNIRTDYDGNSKQKQHFKFVTAVVDLKDFFPDT